jgi:bifunctional UDP-N-acetylglucosamine pyrophosphorylase/glucosamine-1-phosphate N-acetyltransferase
MRNTSLPRIAVILAAGQGSRLKSKTPKVLHEVSGRPMIQWVLDAARAANCDRTIVVIGHGGDKVQAALDGDDVTCVVQRSQRGTGDALAQVEAVLEGPALLLVLSGDVPLISERTLEQVFADSMRGWGAMVVADVDEPGSLGRVVVQEDGSLGKIVEAADASPDLLALRCVNAGVYVLPTPGIFEYLRALEPMNSQSELYLTDALSAAATDGKAIRLSRLKDPSEALGVNSRADLAKIHQELNRRKVQELMDQGVTVIDPARVTVESQVRVARDTVLHPDVALYGAVHIGEDCVIHQGAWISNSTLKNRVIVKPYSVLDGADIGSDSHIGPFARLRPGTRLEESCRVGNYVEIKNSHLEKGVKASHLTYLGDATVGEETNIGAGVVTCNYDGVKKHPTKIGRKVFVGSDTMLIAPVEIGDEAVIGAGSVITKDVPSGALAVERSRERHVPGWKARRRKDPEG